MSGVLRRPLRSMGVIRALIGAALAAAIAFSIGQAAQSRAVLADSDQLERFPLRAYSGRVDPQASSAHSRASGNPGAARSESSDCCAGSPLSRGRTDTKHRFHLIETHYTLPPFTSATAATAQGSEMRSGSPAG